MHKSSKIKIQSTKLDPIQRRINRAIGQVNGVRGMYEEGRDCNEIVQQINAARSALGKIASLMLTGEAKMCAKKGKVKDFEKVLDNTYKTL